MSKFLDTYLKFVNLHKKGITELPIDLGSWKSEIIHREIPMNQFSHLFEARLNFSTGCQIELGGKNDGDLIGQAFRRIRRAISYEMYGDYKEKLYKIGIALERRDFIKAMDKLQDLIKSIDE